MILWTGVDAGQRVRLDWTLPGSESWIEIAKDVTGNNYVWYTGPYIYGRLKLRVMAIGSSNTTFDTTDSNVSIVITSYSVKPVDFGAVNLYDSRDTMVTGVVRNTDNIHLNVDSLYLRGLDSGSFQILSPLGPFRIGAGDSITVHLRVAPRKLGPIQAIIEVMATGPITRLVEVKALSVPGPLKLRLLHPNGGESFGLWDTVNFHWENNPSGNAVTLEYSTDMGVIWLPIADSIVGDSYQWIVPKTPGLKCLARVFGGDPEPVWGDTSNSPWRIDMPSSGVWDHFDLPPTKIGSSSTATSDLFVKNFTVAKLYVESFAIMGEHASEFEIITGQAPFLLLPNQRSAVGFRFTPAAAGLRIVDVVTVARDADTVRTELRGVGLENTTDVPETGSGRVVAVEKEYLHVQPNPARDEVLIRYDVGDAASVRLVVYNTMGEVIEVLQDGPTDPGVYGVRAIISTLPAGTYFLILRVGNKLRSQKLIRE